MMAYRGFISRRLFFSVWAVSLVICFVGCEPLPSSLMVETTGRKFQWHHRYPGPDGRLRTADDIFAQGNLHLPAHTKTTIRLTSDDFIYTLSLPQIGEKEMAVPEMFFFITFKTDSVGTFDLLGDQLCGYAHRSLIANLIVQSRANFEAWRNQMQSKARIN